MNLVLYDGRCPICRKGARRIAAVVGRRGFRVVPLQRRWVRDRVAVPREDLMKAMHVVRVDGSVAVGVDALLHIARHVWWAWPLWAFAHLPGVRGLLGLIYARIARNRYAKGCKSGACAIR